MPHDVSKVCDELDTTTDVERVLKETLTAKSEEADIEAVTQVTEKEPSTVEVVTKVDFEVKERTDVPVIQEPAEDGVPKRGVEEAEEEKIPEVTTEEVGKEAPSELSVDEAITVVKPTESERKGEAEITDETQVSAVKYSTEEVQEAGERVLRPSEVITEEVESDASMESKVVEVEITVKRKLEQVQEAGEKMLRPSDVESEVLESEETTRRKLEEDIRIEAQPPTVERIVEEVQEAGEKVLRPSEAITKGFEIDILAEGKVDEVRIEAPSTNIEPTSDKMQEAEEKVFRTREAISEVIESEETADKKVLEEVTVGVLEDSGEFSKVQVVEARETLEEVDESIDLLPETDRSVDTSKVVSNVTVKFSDGISVEMPYVVSKFHDELDTTTDVERVLKEILTEKSEETEIEAVTEVTDKEPSTVEAVTEVDFEVKDRTDVPVIQEPAEAAIPKRVVEEAEEGKIPYITTEEVGKEVPSELSIDDAITVARTKSERKGEAEITDETQVPTVEYSREEVQEAGERVLRPSEVITEEVESEASMESKAVEVAITVKPKSEQVQEAGEKMLRPGDVLSEVIESEETTRRKLDEDVRIAAQPRTVDRVAEGVQEAGEKMLRPSDVESEVIESEETTRRKLEEDIRIEAQPTTVERVAEEVQEAGEKMLRPSDVESEVIESEETTRRKLDEDIRIEAQPTTAERVAADVQETGEKVLRPNESITKDFEIDEGKVDEVRIDATLTDIEPTSDKMQEAEEAVYRTREVISKVIESEEPADQKVWDEVTVGVLKDADVSSQEQVAAAGELLEQIDESIELLPESDRSVDTSKVVSGVTVKFSDGIPVEMPHDVSKVYDELDITTDVECVLKETLSAKSEETDIEGVTEVTEKEPSTVEVLTKVDFEVKEQTDVPVIQETAKATMPRQGVEVAEEEETREVTTEEVGKEASSEMSGDEAITVEPTESERKGEAEITDEKQVSAVEYSREEVQEAGERVLRPSEVITEEVESEVSIESKAVEAEITVKRKLEQVQEAGEKMLRPNDVESEVIESEETTRKLEEDIKFDAQPTSVESVSEEVQEAGEKVLQQSDVESEVIESEETTRRKLEEDTRIEAQPTTVESVSEEVQEAGEKMLRPSDVESEVIESEETTRRKLDENIRIEAQPTTVETIAEEVQVAGEKVLRPSEETTKEFETEMFREGKIDKVSVETKVTTIDVTSHKTQEAEENISGVSEIFPEVLEMEKPAAGKVKEETPVEVFLEAADHDQEKIQEVEVKMEEAEEFIDLLPESDRSVDTSTVVSGVSVKFPDGFHVQKPEDISQGYDEVESAAGATSLVITPLTPEAEETGLETSTAVSEREPSTEELATATEVGVKEQTDAWEAQEPAETAIYKQETQYDGEEEIPEEFVEDVGIAAPSELSAGEVMQTESESKVEAETTAETEVPTMEYTRKEIQEAAEKVLGLRPGEVISEETAAKVESKFDDVSVFEMEAEDRMLRPSEVVSEGIESTKRAEEEVRIEAEEVSVESVSEKVQETEEKLLKPTEEITKEFEIDISAAGKTDAVTVETHVTSMESTSNKMQESEGKVLRVHDVVTEVIESEESEAHKGWEEVTIGGRLKDAEEPSQEQIHGAGVGNLQLEEADEMTDFLPESVRKERIEGELKEIEDTKEKETVKEDGTRVKTTTKTIAHVQIVTEVTWKDDVNTGETERQELVGKDINEEIVEIAPGIDDLGAENVRIETSVTDSEKTLADGTWERRKTIKKTIRPSVFGVEPSVEEKKQQKMKIDEQSQIEGEGAMEVVSEQLEEAGEVLFEPREDITRKTDVFSEERTSWEVNENLVESMVQSESGWIAIRQPKSVIESDYRDKLAPDFTESNSFETVDFSEHSVQKVAEPTASNTERTEQEDLGFEEFSEEYSVTKSTKFVAHETVDGSISDSKNKIARVKDVGAEADTSVDAEEKGFEDYSEEYWETRKTIVANDEVATAKKTGQERTSEDTGLASNTEVVYEVDNMEKSVAGISGHEEENLDTSVANEWCVVDRETFDTEEHTMHSYEVITTVKQKKTRTVMIRSIGPDGEISENLETEEYESSNESESLSRRSSIDSTTETLATGEMAVQKYDPELRNITVFTDTIEEDPVVDTEMMEYEDTLPDGTIVKRKVTKTKTKQSVVRRVVLEGLDDEPSFVDPSSQALVQVRPGVQQFTRYSDHHSTEPDVTTDIQVTEDKLPDGTVVRKRITNTKQQQLITERLVLGGTGLFDEEGGEDEVFESLKKMGSSPRNSLELQALKERLSSSGTSVPGDRTPSSAASGQKEMDEWEIVDKQ